MDISSWDGTLSSRDFFLAACTLVDKWKKANPEFPPWSWVCSQRQSLVAAHEVEGYLSMENVCCLRSNEDDPDVESCVEEEEEPSCSDIEEITDNATLVLNNHYQAKY